MKQLKDYRWLGNRYKINDYILNDRSWEEISKCRMIGGFLSILVGVKLLEAERGKILRCSGEAIKGTSSVKFEVGDILK